MILKKIFAAAMLALPFALLYLLMSVAYTPSGEGYDDLKDFVAFSGVDMRGKIEPPPDFDIQEPVAFGGGGCKLGAVFSSERLKGQ